MSAIDWICSYELFNTIFLVELEANEVLVFFQVVVSTL